ncbi:hypothetical protein [Mycolicibacterium sp. BiH015]|uniref:hypothetical protein n=1 Tax=Mycolicibacterium sp. BiH015 TaxID=3018808 RepID=UPI0022E6F026|nr:hypothetical protein [Mycolicibacterium sp. BiH015]
MLSVAACGGHSESWEAGYDRAASKKFVEMMRSLNSSDADICERLLGMEMVENSAGLNQRDFIAGCRQGIKDVA